MRRLFRREMSMVDVLAFVWASVDAVAAATMPGMMTAQGRHA